MNMKCRHPRFLGISLVLLVTFLFQSCSNSRYRQEVSVEQRLIINPPSMVEKLWLARHHYDEERRLIVPKVGGSRWGAVQEYTADGNLVYRDWWVRNLKVEDLEAAPSTEIEVVREEDTSARPPVLGISGIDVEQDNPETEQPTTDDPFGTDAAAPATPAVDPFAGDSPANDPFAPVPAVEGDLPEMSDPFAPLPDAGSPEATPAPAPEADPFAPLPSPF